MGDPGNLVVLRLRPARTARQNPLRITVIERSFATREECSTWNIAVLRPLESEIAGYQEQSQIRFTRKNDLSRERKPLQSRGFLLSGGENRQPV